MKLIKTSTNGGSATFMFLSFPQFNVHSAPDIFFCHRFFGLVFVCFNIRAKFPDACSVCAQIPEHLRSQTGVFKAGAVKNQDQS